MANFTGMLRTKAVTVWEVKQGGKSLGYFTEKRFAEASIHITWGGRPIPDDVKMELVTLPTQVYDTWTHL